MAAKKEAQTQYPGCLGTTCADGTCLACQVSQSERHHEDVIAAIKDLGAHIGDVAVELTNLRRHLGGPTAPTPAARAAPAAEAKAPEATAPAAETKPAETAPAKKLTIDTVRPAVLEWVKANGREKLVTILSEFGAQKFPDVKDADLPKFVDRLGIKV